MLSEPVCPSILVALVAGKLRRRGGEAGGGGGGGGC